MYHYLGDERLQLFFYSPNICGAFLAVLSMILCGLFIYAADVHEWKKRKCLWLFSGTVTVCLWLLLGGTYSRGGYVGCFLGLLFCACIVRKKQHFSIIPVFLCCIFLAKHGLSRAAAIGNFADRSILNRLWLWDGAARIIAEFPNGMGEINKAGEYYSLYIQPAHVQERYCGMINDFLTFSASRGIFAAQAVLAFLILLFTWGIRYGKQCKNPFFLYLLGAVFAGIVCGCFSTTYMDWSYFWIPFSLTVLIACWEIFLLFRKRLSFRRTDIVLVIGVPVIICGSVYMYGVIRNHESPYSFEKVKIEIDGKSYTCTNLNLKQRSNGHILCFYEEPERILHRELFPVAVSHNITFSIVQMQPGIHSIDAVSEIIRQQLNTYQNIDIYAVDRTWSLTVLAAMSKITGNLRSGIKTVFLTDLPASWPFQKLDPCVNLQKNSDVSVFLRFSTETKEEILWKKEIEKISKHIYVIPYGSLEKMKQESLNYGIKTQ